MQSSVLNIEVSGYKTVSAKPSKVSLLNWLNNPKFLAVQNEIRQLTNIEEIKAAKIARLPCITPSGLFTSRDEKSMVKHSGLIQVDIDQKDNLHISNYDNLKQELCRISNVAYCGQSVSGKGYWCLIPIADPANHSLYFDHLEQYFKAQGIIIDRAPRNPASKRFYSYDADAYFNHQAKPIQVFYKKEKPSPKKANNRNVTETNARVTELVNQITSAGIDITQGYDNWLSIAFALADEFGEAGRDYFHDLSSVSGEYNPADADRQYTHCLNHKPTSQRVTIATLFHLAKQVGAQIDFQKPINHFQ